MGDTKDKGAVSSENEIQSRKSQKGGVASFECVCVGGCIEGHVIMNLQPISISTRKIMGSLLPKQNFEYLEHSREKKKKNTELTVCFNSWTRYEFLSLGLLDQKHMGDLSFTGQKWGTVPSRT